MTAVHARRCSVSRRAAWGVQATDVDPRLITVAAFKCIKGERMGPQRDHVVHGGCDVGPPPSSRLRNANDLQIHYEIKAEYNDCIATGLKPPNLKETGKVVQDRLRTSKVDASASRIQELAGDPRYDGLRREPGKTLASEQRKRLISSFFTRDKSRNLVRPWFAELLKSHRNQSKGDASNGTRCYVARARFPGRDGWERRRACLGRNRNREGNQPR